MELRPWEAASCAATQEFPNMYGTQRFITMFTRSLSWARSIQSIPPHPISLRSTYHLRLGLPSGLFPSGFPTKILYAFIFSPIVLHATPISSSLTWSFLLYLANSRSYEDPRYAVHFEILPRHLWGTTNRDDDKLQTEQAVWHTHRQIRTLFILNIIVC
jgi:hypothetical protein